MGEVNSNGSEEFHKDQQELVWSLLPTRYEYGSASRLIPREEGSLVIPVHAHLFFVGENSKGHFGIYNDQEVTVFPPEAEAVDFNNPSLRLEQITTSVWALILSRDWTVSEEVAEVIDPDEKHRDKLKIEEMEIMTRSSGENRWTGVQQALYQRSRALVSALISSG